MKDVVKTKRLERFAEAYQRELSDILRFHVRDPRLSGITITHVVFTPDLRLAKVYFDIAGGKARVREVIQGLIKSKGFLKRTLAERVEVKFAPDLKFYHDESSEVKEEIDDLFERIKNDETGEENKSV